MRTRIFLPILLLVGVAFLASQAYLLASKPTFWVVCHKIPDNYGSPNVGVAVVVPADVGARMVAQGDRFLEETDFPFDAGEPCDGGSWSGWASFAPLSDTSVFAAHPVPSTLMLTLSAIGGLFYFGRRKMRRSE